MNKNCYLNLNEINPEFRTLSWALTGTKHCVHLAKRWLKNRINCSTIFSPHHSQWIYGIIFRNSVVKIQCTLVAHGECIHAIKRPCHIQKICVHQFIYSVKWNANELNEKWCGWFIGLWHCNSVSILLHWNTAKSPIQLFHQTQKYPLHRLFHCHFSHASHHSHSICKIGIEYCRNINTASLLNG